MCISKTASVVSLLVLSYICMSPPNLPYSRHNSCSTLHRRFIWSQHFAKSCHTRMSLSLDEKTCLASTTKSRDVRREGPPFPDHASQVRKGSTAVLETHVTEPGASHYLTMLSVSLSPECAACHSVGTPPKAVRTSMKH